MQRVKELLSRISDLSDAELQELRQLILAMVEENNKNKGKVFSEMDMEDLSVLASAAQAVRDEVDRRDLLTQQRHADEQALTAAAADLMTVPAGRDPRVAAHRTGGGATAVTASGLPVQHADQLTGELIDAVRRIGMSRGADGDRTRVARISWARPADRTLDGNDPEAVTAALATASAAHAEAVARTLIESPDGMVAAGGFGAARQPLYDLPGFETNARPVRAALPGFTVTRGGVTFSQPPTLADLNGATSIWTVQNDIDAATNTAVRKPAVRVLPGAPVTVDLQAVVSQVVYGNLISRANPEFTRRVMDLAVAHAAVVAEQQLLTQIGSLSTAVTGVGADTGLGATRVLLPVLERAAAAVRNRGRMPADAPLQCFLPAWTRNLLRADLTAQEPGDAVLGVSDGEISRYLAMRRLAVTFTLDGEAGQAFGAQTPGGALADFPASVVCYLFAAGSFAFADGGMLDLGIVRDSVLNAANDCVVFSETFEAVLHRGGEALRLTVPVTASGVSRAAA